MRSSVILIALSISTILHFSGCKTINNHFDSRSLDCGSEDLPRDYRILPIEDENGKVTYFTEATGIFFEELTSKKQPIVSRKLTSRGCLLVPMKFDIGKVVVPSIKQGNLKFGDSVESIRIRALEEPQLEPLCEKASSYVAESLPIRFNFQDQNRAEDLDVQILAKSIERDTEVLLFKKAIGESLNLPQNLNVTSLEEGVYRLQVRSSSRFTQFSGSLRTMEKDCLFSVLRSPDRIEGKVSEDQYRIFEVGDFLDWRPLDLNSKLKACIEEAGKGSECSPSGKCRNDANFELASKIKLTHPGINRVFAYTENLSGVKSRTECQNLAVWNGQPDVEITFPEKELNRKLRTYRLPLADIDLLINPIHPSISEETLLSNMECKVDFHDDENSSAQNQSPVCTRGDCEGRKLDTFTMCNRQLSFSLAQARSIGSSGIFRYEIFIKFFGGRRNEAILKNTVWLSSLSHTLSSDPSLSFRSNRGDFVPKSAAVDYEGNIITEQYKIDQNLESSRLTKSDLGNFRIFQPEDGREIYSFEFEQKQGSDRFLFKKWSGKEFLTHRKVDWSSKSNIGSSSQATPACEEIRIDIAEDVWCLQNDSIVFLGGEANLKLNLPGEREQSLNRCPEFYQVDGFASYSLSKVFLVCRSELLVSSEGRFKRHPSSILKGKLVHYTLKDKHGVVWILLSDQSQGVYQLATIEGEDVVLKGGIHLSSLIKDVKLHLDDGEIVFFSKKYDSFEKKWINLDMYKIRSEKADLANNIRLISSRSTQIDSRFNGLNQLSVDEVELGQIVRFDFNDDLKSIRRRFARVGLEVPFYANSVVPNPEFKFKGANRTRVEELSLFKNALKANNVPLRKVSRHQSWIDLPNRYAGTNTVEESDGFVRTCSSDHFSSYFETLSVFDPGLQTWKILLNSVSLSAPHVLASICDPSYGDAVILFDNSSFYLLKEGHLVELSKDQSPLIPGISYFREMNHLLAFDDVLYGLDAVQAKLFVVHSEHNRPTERTIDLVEWGLPNGLKNFNYRKSYDGSHLVFSKDGRLFEINFQEAKVKLIDDLSKQEGASCINQFKGKINFVIADSLVVKEGGQTKVVLKSDSLSHSLDKSIGCPVFDSDGGIWLESANQLTWKRLNLN